MEIHESAEDYLEAILRLSQETPEVRSVDIASMLKVSKPSVSHAMKLLRENGYIAMDRYGTITLQETGREIAERIFERHKILSAVFESLGVDPEVAMADACKVEHDLSEETFEKIKGYYQQMQKPCEEAGQE
jgi:Mn-dependent DtxR family transcriptional regulator